MCPSKSNSQQIELTVPTSCYWGLRLTLCYSFYIHSFQQDQYSLHKMLSFRPGLNPIKAKTRKFFCFPLKFFSFQEILSNKNILTKFLSLALALALAWSRSRSKKPKSGLNYSYLGYYWAFLQVYVDHPDVLYNALIQILFCLLLCDEQFVNCGKISKLLQQIIHFLTLNCIQLCICR